MQHAFVPIDIYCERAAAGLVAEPLNAITNLAFFIAAYLIAQKLRQRSDSSLWLWTLCALVALIGLGSGLFHTFANNLTIIMDVVPITVFLLCYIWVFCRTFSFSVITTFAALVLFMLLSFATGLLPESLQLNGSISYFPALLYVGLMTAWALRKSLNQTAYYLKIATLLFILSLTFRSVDMLVCEVLASGTHFIWHILNAAVLYCAVMAVTPAALRGDDK